MVKLEKLKPKEFIVLGGLLFLKLADRSLKNKGDEKDDQTNKESMDEKTSKSK